MAIEKTIILNVDADDGIKEVEQLDESVNKLDDSVEKVGKDSTKTGKQSKKGFEQGSKGVRKFATAIKGVGIAIKAAGIGLLIAAVAKFQELFVGDLATDSLTIAAQTLNNIFKGQNFEIAFQNAQETVRLQKEIEINAKRLEKFQLNQQEIAEKERQIRDDVSISIVRRIEANEKLGVILENQLEFEKKLALESLNFARSENEKLGTQESYLALLDAEIKLAEINERITSQRSEQKVNEVALQQELNTLLETQSQFAIEVFRISNLGELRLLELQKERIRIQFEEEDALLAKRQDNLEVGTQAYADATLERQALNREFQISTINTEKVISKQKKDIVNDFANAAIDAFGKASAAGKAFAVAQAIWNVHEGITKALTLKPPFNFIAAATVALKGFASVRSILSTPSPGGGGGGAPSGLSAPSFPPLAPEFNVIGASGTNQLAESISTQTQQPIKAIVVASEVTSQQALDRQITDTATFG